VIVSTERIAGNCPVRTQSAEKKANFWRGFERMSADFVREGIQRHSDSAEPSAATIAVIFRSPDRQITR
jgi:hypothetical protein